MIYLLRHAIAAERGATPDPDRPLTPEGREKLRRMLRWADRQGIRPERVWTSPYLRCRQTAQEVQRHFDCPLTLVEQLAPGGAFEELLPNLKEETILVGHEPDLSEMLELLLCGLGSSAPDGPALAEIRQTRAGHGPMVVFKKAGLAGLDWNGEQGQLNFLVSPKWVKQ